MDKQETEMKTVESEKTIRDETQRDAATDDNSQKTNETREYDILRDFAKKVDDQKFKEEYKTHNAGNVTNQNIFNIHSMDGNISFVRKEDNISKAAAGNRQYKLNERQDCSNFVTQYKISLHLAYAIVTSMFEYVPVSDLQRLSESLLQRFKEFPKEYDENGKEITTNINPFISLDTIVNTIGAKICNVSFTSQSENITERCISFEEARDKVMENFWELFPMIRSEITSWLINTDFNYSYRNAFSTRCFVEAMANIVRMDFGDSMNRLFKQLESQEKNKYLMIRVMLVLIKDDNTKKNAYEILKRWAGSTKWLWEIPLVVYTLAEEELPFADELERTVTEKILESFHDEHDVWTIYLIAGKMTDSLRLRNMVSRALYKLITDGNKETVAAMYLVIIANSYLFIEKENLAMPLVAVDNKGQIQNIELLLYKIFSDFALRHSLLEVLEVYLKKINQYEVTERLLNQLKSYFYVIARKSERFNRDVQRFLSNLDKKGNTTAEKILLFLQEKLQKKELIKR